MARPPRRFRVNPAEFLVFAVVMGVFANSAYRVFYDWNDGLKGFEWVASGATPAVDAEAAATASVRHPASLPGAGSRSTTAALATIEVACGGGTLDIRGARRARLSGKICGEGGTLLRAEIVNEGTGAEAHVFADTENSRFSTDYIAMRPGDNPVQLRFVYEGGQIVSNRVTLKRAE